MTTATEIMSAIEQLDLSERAKLAKLMNGWEDDDWDKQMADDFAAGKLDKLLKEVDEDIKAGRMRDMP